MHPRLGSNEVSQRRATIPATAAMLVVVISAGAVLLLRPLGIKSLSPALSECPDRVICDDANAISLSTQLFPGQPAASVARLVTLGDANSWQGALMPDPADPTLQEPVWVVGLLGEGLHVSDMGFPTDNDLPIAGMWYVWVASGAGMESRGGLAPDDFVGAGAIRYAEIEAMVSQPLSLDEPTPFPTVTPGPTPTAEGE